MEKKNPNIYQRALDIVNNRINPDIPQGGGGGEHAPEVENAIETHGMGWTDTEEKAGFDIQWDGNTEGLETFLFMEGFNPTYKVSDKIVTSMESLIGSKFTLSAGAGSYDYEMPTNNGVKTLTNYSDSMKEMFPSFPDMFGFGLDVEHDLPLGFILPVDIDVDDEDLGIHMHASAGIYFAKFDWGGTQYVISRFYKEATTEEVVHQIDQKYIPGGSAPEVENAIETHGMGWTDTEEKAGFDIQWDGNTEGLESQYSMYRVTDDVYNITSSNDLIGVYVTTNENGEESTFVLTEDNIATVDDDGKMVMLSDSTGAIGMVAIEDVTMGSSLIKRGFWLVCADPAEYSFYISRLYKEATTEEVVHQIDQKYIPGGSGGVMVVNFEINPQTMAVTADKTVDEVKTAMLTMPVIGVFKIMADGTVVSSGGLGCATADRSANPAFGCYYNTTENQWMKQIGVVDDNWAFAVEE